MVLAEPRVRAPLIATFPGIVTGVPVLPMTTAVEEAVPTLSVPALSTVTSASPNMPELLTVNMALAVRVTDPKRQRTASNRLSLSFSTTQSPMRLHIAVNIYGYEVHLMISCYMEKENGLPTGQSSWAEGGRL